MTKKILLFFIAPVFSSFLLFSQSKLFTENTFVLSKMSSPAFNVDFTYNEQGMVTSEKKVVNGDDYLSYIYEYQYDENNNLTLLKKYDKENTNWLFNYKEENKYNTNNLISLKKIFRDYGNGFVFTEQFFYYYTNITLDSIVCQLVSINSTYFNNTKKHFIYSENLLSKIDGYDWVVGNWIHTAITTLDYSENEQLTNSSHEILVGEEFMKNFRFSFIYNEDYDLEVRNLTYPSLNEWNTRPKTQYFYSFDALKDDEQIIYPQRYYFDEMQNYWFPTEKKLVSDDYWLADCGGTLYFQETTNYEYQKVETNGQRDERAKGRIEIYPNPATNYFTINWNSVDCNKIEIYNMLGNLVFETQSITQRINIENLKSGIYFVKFINNSKTISTNKLIKK